MNPGGSPPPRLHGFVLPPGQLPVCQCAVCGPTGRARPLHHPGGCPFQRRLRALGTMLGLSHILILATVAKMRRNALAPVKDLHRCRRGPSILELSSESIRHAVPVAVKGDVIVDIDASLHPMAQALKRNLEPLFTHTFAGADWRSLLTVRRTP